MAHYAKLLLTIGSLLTASFSMAASADDNGNCREIYKQVNGRFTNKEEVDAASDAKVTTLFGAGAGATSIVSAAKGRWAVAAVTGVVAAGLFVSNYFSNQDSALLASNKQKYILNANGGDRDTAFIYEVYSDAASGLTNTDATNAVAEQLAIDKQHEDKLFQHLVDEMENGSLCENGRAKPLGKVFAELKNYEETKLRGAY